MFCAFDKFNLLVVGKKIECIYLILINRPRLLKVINYPLRRSENRPFFGEFNANNYVN